ncbi:lysozyme inhibitor LprI family protein [Celeribacter indicus]|uniref:Lysozyme inhibitor LprI N-terminal domain-containing protein n=1 Tax=Celeribacter indicus TaxID=1208324 RepID=A0A0B5DZ51_9RHOB|nr:periplasmic protein [Celeribacter indicus]AJE48269.1 hypothetical protein P73_3554 [Celeribacter indicus]SDW71191.1 hypothetical protein SAMN05443573_10697 [Celeribacter indicus]
MKSLFLCLVLALPGTALAPAAMAASFDCDLPDLAPDEQVICDTRELNDADVRMVTTFDFLTGLFAMGMRGSIQDSQIAWLKQRQACGADAACIRDAYDRRQKALEEIYQGIDRPL